MWNLGFKGGPARIVDQRLTEVIWDHDEVLLKICGDKTREAVGIGYHAQLEIIMIQYNQ